ncbi:PucR family transcriptional regulator [Shouchella clausii]|uniref:PucR family transcriptional regulator n=1 Tax=Shouchella clausii TaxID=79880 RepID=UPI000BA5FC94|nr:helix-turn-helix domain-containing protein [Shouchella clausii]PAD92162.1 hypothetical protein CHH52_11060 [Shouchella clausii]
MITELKTQFAHALWKPGDNLSDRWALQSENRDTVSFNRQKLTDRERLLLSLLLSEPLLPPAPQSKEEKEWHAYLFGDGQQPPTEETICAVHFQLEKPLEDFAAFREAVLNTFPPYTCFVWQNSMSGMLLFPSAAEDVDLNAVVELIETDFYIGISFMVGTPVEGPKAKAAWRFESELFACCKDDQTKKKCHVLQAAEAGLAYLLKQTPSLELEKLRAHFLPQEIVDDKELVRTVRMYLLENMNSTKAAKTLHLHRNSLQYRIDKFVAVTGIDIRTFPNAAFVALLLP